MVDKNTVFTTERIFFNNATKYYFKKFKSRDVLYFHEIFKTAWKNNIIIRHAVRNGTLWTVTFSKITKILHIRSIINLMEHFYFV